MMNKKILFVMVLFFSINSFGGEFKGSYEEGYVEINVNKKINYSFFPIYMDYELEEPYVGVMNLFSITMSTGMKIDKKEKRIYGKLGEVEYEFFYDNTQYITVEKDVYIRGKDLSKVFNLKSYEWNTETYVIDIKTKFKTPYEIYQEQDEKLKGLNGKEEEKIDESDVFIQDRKLFTPGVLRPRYSNYGIDDNDVDGNLSVRYDTHLLYGDFTTTGFLDPDQYLGYTALTYNEIIDGKSIVLGDSFMETYEFLDSRRLTGISVKNWNGGLGDIEVGQTTIRGFAPFNSRVELYRNGSLFGFTRVGTDGSYVFENINIQNYNDVYTVKIYNFDGTIEVRQVSMLSGSKILKKGKFDYEFLAGTFRDIDEDDDEERIDLEEKSIEGNIRTSYGVTNNLTLGFEYINSLTEESEGDIIFGLPTELAGVNLYYTTGAVKYPTYFELSEIYDLEYDVDNKNTHIGKVRQKVGSRSVLSLEAYQYSDYIAFLEGYENRYLIDWRSNIDRYWGYTIRYDNIDDFGVTEEYLSGSVYRNKNNTSHELGIIYPFNESNRSSRVFYNYSKNDFRIRNTDFNLFARINSDFNRDDEDEEVDIRVGLKTIQNKKLTGGIYVEYNSSSEYELGIEIAYKLYDWIEVITDAYYNNNDSDYSLGVDMEKTIILEKPLTKNSNAYPSDSWVEGKVFMDEDNDGVFDEDEETLEGVEVKVGRRSGTSDKDGEYFIDNISSYEIEDFEVDLESLDPMLEAAHRNKYIKLYPATGGKIDIPIQPISVIMGSLKFEGEVIDALQYFPVTSMLYIQLLNVDGKMVMEQRLEPEGFYMLDRVLPGKYILKMDYRGEGNLRFEKEEKNIEVKLDRYGSYYEDYDFSIKSYNKE